MANLFLLLVWNAKEIFQKSRNLHLFFQSFEFETFEKNFLKI